MRLCVCVFVCWLFCLVLFCVSVSVCVCVCGCVGVWVCVCVCVCQCQCLCLCLCLCLCRCPSPSPSLSLAPPPCPLKPLIGPGAEARTPCGEKLTAAPVQSVLVCEVQKWRGVLADSGATIMASVQLMVPPGVANQPKAFCSAWCRIMGPWYSETRAGGVVHIHGIQGCKCHGTRT